MTRSTEYAPTVAAVKRGLRAIGYTQDRAARETEQSPALVSMVLNRKVKSKPCLQKLAGLIKAKSAEPEPAAPLTP
jgi:hypothetical protein